MKTTHIHLRRHVTAQPQYNKHLLERLEQLAPTSPSRKLALLSLRRPAKIMSKIEIKQLIQHEKRPVFAYSKRNENSNEEQYQMKTDNSSENKLEFNIRNFISKSVPYVSSHTKQSPTTIKRTIKDFRISRQAKTTHKQILQKSKKDYIRIDQQVDVIANLRKQFNFQNKQGIRSRKNKVTFYMNNFRKTKYSKPRKISLETQYEKKMVRENLQGNGFFPWEKPCEDEDSLQIN